MRVLIEGEKNAQLGHLWNIEVSAKCTVGEKSQIHLNPDYPTLINLYLERCFFSFNIISMIKVSM